MLTIFSAIFYFFFTLRYYAARHKRRLKEEYADHHNEKLRPIDLIALRPKAFKYQVLSQIPSQAPYTEMDEYGLFKNVVSLCCTIIGALAHYNWNYGKNAVIIHIHHKICHNCLGFSSASYMSKDFHKNFFRKSSQCQF